MRLFFSVSLVCAFVFNASLLQAKPQDHTAYPHSLFYNAQELAFIYAALKTGTFFPQANIPLEAPSSAESDRLEKNAQLLFVTEEVTPSSLSSFSLNSIIFRGKRDWAVWINGQKYTRQRMPDHFRISAVSPNRVTLDITVPDLGYWLDGHTHLRHSLNGYWDTAHPKRNVLLNTNGNKIRLVLAPNQSFSPYKMAIIDGNINPMVVLEKEIVKEIVTDESKDYFETIAQEAYKAKLTAE